MTARPVISKRITQTRRITLHAPLQRVFPLFGFIKEKAWADGWDFHIVYSESGEMEEHAVFTTTPSPGYDESDYTWMVSKYDPEQAMVEYTVFTSERLWTITIRCAEQVSGMATDADITYTYTGLTERGNTINESKLQAMYAQNLQDWETAINHYLTTGECLKSA